MDIEPGREVVYRPLLVDKLQALVVIQCFDGHWPWHDQLLRLIEYDESAIKSVMDPSLMKLRNANDVMATACVVVWLRKKRPDDQDVWELIVEKAVSWLAREIGKEKTEKVFDQIETVI
jgi:hypothetical protein